MGILKTTIKLGIIFCLFLNLGHVSAEVVRHKLTVSSVSYDTWGLGLQVGDELGFLEYDNAGLVRWYEDTEETVDVTVLTAFSFSFLGKSYGLDDLEFSQVSLDDDNLYEHPYTFFEISTTDFRMNWLARSPYEYVFEGDDPSRSSDYFGMEVSSSVVPVPAAVWLFGSGLGLLGWMRRRQLS